MISVRITRDQCISCEACWIQCPEVFQPNAEDSLSEITPEYRVEGDNAEGEIPDELRVCAQSAADQCPVSIIHVEDH